MSESQGQFVWYELNTTDPKGAVKFYKDVIGWGTEPFGESYMMWTVDGVAIGGLMTLPEEPRKKGVPPYWLGYVAADDVDALTAKAESLGGRSIVHPNDIPTVGRFSVIADPQGAVIALFKPSGPPMARPAETAAGRISWHELMAGEWEAAYRFYAQLFGWQKMEALPSPIGVYQTYGKGGRTLGGMATKPPGYPAPPHWLYYIRVDDLDGALGHVKTGGGQVMNGPMQVPGGDRVAQCADPQGAAFALHGR